MRRMGMFDDIAERFLCDAIKFGLDLEGQTIFAGAAKFDRDIGAAFDRL